MGRPKKHESIIEREHSISIDRRYTGWASLSAAIVELHIDDCGQLMCGLYSLRHDKSNQKTIRIKNLKRYMTKQELVDAIESERLWFNGPWCEELEIFTGVKGSYIYESLKRLYLIEGEAYAKTNKRIEKGQGGKQKTRRTRKAA